MADAVVTRGDRAALSRDESQVLDMQALPTAKRWLKTYPTGGNMYQHAMQTLRYWSEPTE